VNGPAIGGLPADLLDRLVALARQAAEVALAYYRRDFAVRSKPDATPVTDADMASEAVILAGLRQLTPEIPVIAEEALARGETRWNDASPPRLFWLVDPLDGTREFVARNDEFSINIGLAADRRAALGVVHAPVSGITYGTAGRGEAFIWRGDAEPAPIRARPAPVSGLVVLSSRSHGDRAALDAFLSQYNIAERRMLGSAIKFGAIAAGEADLYPRFGPTMEWDTCAGHAILEAAGGVVVTAAGAPLLYGKPGFRNPDFIARGG
jgi:3'(2'), 5'-bisphosphate nucleotidase